MGACSGRLGREAGGSTSRRERWEGEEGNHCGRSRWGMRKEGEVKVGSSLDSQIW